VLAEALVEKVFGTSQVKVLEKQKGADFTNRKYIPLFDYYQREYNEYLKDLKTGEALVMVTTEESNHVGIYKLPPAPLH
jgi:hypothetical protein